ncbi:SEC-C metal-binding domain-containing protein [Anaerobacillus isosaccharinicus]|uniref:SEC-C domain-containing protein n=1 Tax=Anaerobacillus isosaccharinicus TaxID=1532552 RepID=A0A1S2M441_9BACI|nr:SEC-C metal-binding domain-containing protein [Anaerobacillus isosaccharinicus]MBA5586399.1 SEC-C domain-containing protein [Anaerobacillus isosaccharinicus]QOY35356.1 SEC-C domain-containing protein [Anaerobacillus isosaccharinicus]
MNNNRNALCSCGSGKKYKKCCLNKQNVIQFSEVKEERFFQQKQSLVEKLDRFIRSKLSTQDLMQLEFQFNDRSSRKVEKKLRNPFSRFWLYFFHQYENSLRGVEWFYKENVTSLTVAEKAMIETWMQLKPKLVQAVEISKEHVIFKDLFTNETFSVCNKKEVVADPIPWYGTLGLLEMFDHNYYFNGVRVMVDPERIDQAAKMISKLVDRTKLSSHEVMMNYFPEILAELLTKSNIEGPKKEKTIKEYVVQYEVVDKLAALTFLTQQYGEYEANGDEKLFSWVGNMNEYRDSEIDQPIYVGTSYGSFSLKATTLTFNTLKEDKLNEFRKTIETKLDVILLKNEVKTLQIPFAAEFHNFVLSMDKNIPQYFAMYVQNSLLLDLDAAIPMFNDRSIRQLVEEGNERKAEVWLQQSEYSVYKNTVSQFGKVEITADFNTVRKELGLPLSKFVTGGENRKTKITEASSDNRGVVQKEDIPFLEQLGFTPETVDKFYTLDILEFYKDKTIGKGEATVRKYTLSLYDLREVLEHITAKSWDDFNYSVWEYLISIRYIGLFNNMSRTQIKDISSVLKAFTKALDEKYKIKVSNDVTKIFQTCEKQLLKCIDIKNSIIPYEYKELLSKHNKNDNFHKLKDNYRSVHRVFQIDQIINNNLVVTELTSSGKQFTVALMDRECEQMEEGFIFDAEVALEKNNFWQIIDLYQVYPPIGKRYLIKK